MMSKRMGAVAAGALAWAAVTGAGAQNCVGRSDFDACMARTLVGQRQQLAASQQRLWQSYLRIELDADAAAPLIPPARRGATL